VVEKIHRGIELHLWVLLGLDMFEVVESIFKECSIAVSLRVNIKETLRLLDFLFFTKPSRPNRIKWGLSVIIAVREARFLASMVNLAVIDIHTVEEILNSFLLPLLGLGAHVVLSFLEHDPLISGDRCTQ